MRIKKQLLKLAIILSSIILILSSLNNINISEDSETVQKYVLNKNNENNNLIPPKSSGAWTYKSIWIDNSGGSPNANGTWAIIAGMHSWCTWTGSEYILEDITLIPGGSGPGILIANSTVDFRIENCTIIKENRGIKFESVSNGEIRNCYIDAWWQGISLYQSIGNDIIENTIYDSGGIYLHESNGNDIIENLIYNDIDLYDSDGNDIIGNSIYGGYGCIVLRISDYNNIYDNILEASNIGIEVDGGDYIDIDGNLIKGGYYGIAIWGSDNSFLTYNTISRAQTGIESEGVTNTEYSFNQIYNAAWGIFLKSNNNCTIEENLIADGYFGISLSGTNNSLFKENLLIDNWEGFGVIPWYWYYCKPNENNTYINNLLINHVESEDYKEKSKTISSYDPSFLYGVLLISSGLIIIIILKKSKVVKKKSGEI